MRYVKDGMVAVLLSNQRSTPWSTWDSATQEKLLFSPEIVRYILGEGPMPDPKDYDGYFPDFDFLEILWVPEGTKFFVALGDSGYEYLTRESQVTWQIA